MLGTPIIVKRGSKGEAEKPFWISYADLMTALMVQFLVAMSVALLAVTKTVSEIERQKAESEQKIADREQDIAKLLDEIEKAAADRYPGIKVNKEQKIIDFGDKAHSDNDKDKLNSGQAHLLRAFVPEVLAIARNELGRKWLKQVVVEGFASPIGTYLHNLNLSLQRSQRVLCVLLAQQDPDERFMSQDEREQIRDLFPVGGYSFNAAKASSEESRRVELRLEFLSIGESRPSTEGAPRGNFGHCALEG